MVRPVDTVSLVVGVFLVEEVFLVDSMLRLVIIRFADSGVVLFLLPLKCSSCPLFLLCVVISDTEALVLVRKLLLRRIVGSVFLLMSFVFLRNRCQRLLVEVIVVDSQCLLSFILFLGYTLVNAVSFGFDCFCVAQLVSATTLASCFLSRCWRLP